jgi:hypothetical protein
MIHTNTSKHIESLELYNDYKSFLDILAGEGGSHEEVNEQAMKKKPKRASQLMQNELEDLNIPPSLIDIIEDEAAVQPPQFADSDELMEIFTVMEEQNLEKIKMM